MSSEALLAAVLRGCPIGDWEEGEKGRCPNHAIPRSIRNDDRLPAGVSRDEGPAFDYKPPCGMTVPVAESNYLVARMMHLQAMGSLSAPRDDAFG